ncbi:MAG: S8 family serine peptidase [Nanoarchaeota archaeon]
MRKREYLLFIILLITQVSAATGLQDITHVIVTFEDHVDSNSKVIDSVIRNIPNDEIDIKHEYKFYNGFSAEVTPDGIKQLENDPRIKLVQPTKNYYIDITEGIKLINASIVHQRQLKNMNLTGSGQTICIVDTGINYTHESFGSCARGDFLAGNCSKIINGTDTVNSDNDPYDDQGHGTHVAGIAAANGSVIGIGPDARLAIAKVCDSSGVCSDADVKAGIEWCTLYAEQYNISVISMSLGDGASYTNATCPSDWDTEILTAVSKNITVVASSGNENYTEGISHPACADNVISVGATYDKDIGSRSWCLKSPCVSSNRCTDAETYADLLTCFSNRASNLDILAPGAIITSLSYDGSTEDRSGTSMATPFVAGMLSVMYQYTLLENGERLNNTIAWAILNQSGVKVKDNVTNYTFSRVELNNAIILLDKQPPVMTNWTRDVENVTNNTNVTFSVTTSDTHLSDVLFESNFEENMTNYTMIKEAGNYSFFVYGGNFTPGKVVSYRFIAIDDNENQNHTAQESFTVQSIPNPLNVELIFPDNDTYLNYSSINFRFNASDNNSEVINCSLYINDLYNQTNTSTLSYQLTNFTISLDEGLATWQISCNGSGNSNITSEKRILHVDKTIPTVSLSSPSDGAAQTSTQVNLDYTPIDTNIANCSLFIDNSFSKSASLSSSGGSERFSNTFSDNTTYNWMVQCTDLANQFGLSETRTFSIAVPEPTESSSDSGGSGGGASTSSDGGGGASSETNELSDNVAETEEDVKTENEKVEVVEEKPTEVVKQPVTETEPENIITGRSVLDTIKLANIPFGAVATGAGAVVLAGISWLFVRSKWRKLREVGYNKIDKKVEDLEKKGKNSS